MCKQIVKPYKEDPRNCKRAEWKDGWCKSHHPDRIQQPTKLKKDGLYTVAGLSKKINISKSRIRDWVCYEPEKLPKREDIKDQIRFDPKVVNAWLAEKRKVKKQMPYKVTPRLQKEGYVWGLQALMAYYDLSVEQLVRELNKKDIPITPRKLGELARDFPIQIKTNLLLALINIFRCSVDDFFVKGKSLNRKVIPMDFATDKQWDWGFAELLKKTEREDHSFRMLATEIEKKKFFNASPGHLCRLFNDIPQFLNTDVLFGLTKMFRCKPSDIFRIK